MTTNLNGSDYHYLFVEFNDGSTDKIKSKSITTLANFVINNNDKIKYYDLSNKHALRSDTYDVLE